MPHNTMLNAQAVADAQPVAHMLFKRPISNRKEWEQAAIYRALKETGNLMKPGIALGLGVGTEPIAYALTNLFAEVHATDRYVQQDEWSDVSPTTMLMTPEAYAPSGVHWNPDNLVVRDMDMRHLDYPDVYFDAIWSCSSIEHVPTWEDLETVLREIKRVLRPGGTLAIVTEYKISGPTDQFANVILFTPERVQRFWELSGCEPIDDFAEGTIDMPPTDLKTYIQWVKNDAPRTGSDMLLKTDEGHIFTSVLLVGRRR